MIIATANHFLARIPILVGNEKVPIQIEITFLFLGHRSIPFGIDCEPNGSLTQVKRVIPDSVNPNG